MGHLDPAKVEQIVKGVAEGCRQAGCALIGGRPPRCRACTRVGSTTWRVFCTALVDKSKIFDNASITEGDVLIALPSSGVHSNGFSLVRHIFGLDGNSEILQEVYPELGTTLGEALLKSTRIYVDEVLGLARQIRIKGASHITGGGFYENIPRSLPSGLGARIRRSDVRVLPIFTLLQRAGSVSEHDMFNTFNMGVGMVLFVGKEDVRTALDLLAGSYVLGEVVASDKACVLV